MSYSSSKSVEKLAVKFAKVVADEMTYTACVATQFELQESALRQKQNETLNIKKNAALGLLAKTIFYDVVRVGASMTPWRDRVLLREGEMVLKYFERMGNVSEDTLMNVMDPGLKTEEGLKFAQARELPRMAALIQKSLS